METAIETPLREAVLREALTGLTATPKTLSPWLFYDERGSELFERITELPEYYLTRTERSIFAKYGPELPLKYICPVTVAGTRRRHGHQNRPAAAGICRTTRLSPLSTHRHQRQRSRRSP